MSKVKANYVGKRNLSDKSNLINAVKSKPKIHENFINPTIHYESRNGTVVQIQQTGYLKSSLYNGKFRNDVDNPSYSLGRVWHKGSKRCVIFNGSLNVVRQEMIKEIKKGR